ncbi:MAG: hypothetical protein ACJ74U_15920 [Jatrophihabitantaceae bacterium]
MNELPHPPVPASPSPDWPSAPAQPNPDWTSAQPPPSPDWPSAPAQPNPDWTSAQPPPNPDWRSAPSPSSPDWPSAPAPPDPAWRSEHATGYLPLPDTVPVPPTPPPRRRPRRLIPLLGIGCLLAALVCGAITVVQYRAERSPAAVVRRYFAALAAGDAAVALGYAAVPARGDYLTASVLRQQLDRASLTGFTVLRSELAGDRGTVSVRYQLRFGTGPRQLTDIVPVVRRGSSWRLERVAASTELAVTSSGIDRLTLAGGTLPSAPVLLFPGALPLGTDNPAVQIDGQPALRLSPAQQSTEITVSLTDAAKTHLRQGLDRALASCLAGGSAQPNCPQAGDSRPVPGSLRGTALPPRQPLRMSLDLGGVVELAGTVTVRGSWQTWDFNNQAVRHTGDTDLDLHASASIAKLDSIYWSSS